MVLCIGYDGHIALENVKTGVCNHTLAKLADELGLPATSKEVSDKAKCCPCSDMNLPGKSLDYPEIPGPDVVCIAEPAEVAMPVFKPDCSESLCVAGDETIPHRRPPDPGCAVVRTALRSVIILV